MSATRESKVPKKPNQYISQKDEADGILYYTLSGTNVSVANGLRRTILSDMPTLVFKTFPDKENQAKIIINKSRFNNEILKQRLGCIPIHGVTHDQPFDELEVIIEKKNDSHEMQYITTEDFKVKNTKSGKFLAASVTRKIFPPDPITHDFILFARLRPRISNEVPGEELKIHAKMSLHTAEDDGSFNIVSCCSYRNTPSKIDQDAAWQEHAKSLIDVGADEIALAKSDWYNHEAGRIFVRDSFDFKIQSLGVFKNTDIVKNACIIIVNKFVELIKQFAVDKIGEVVQPQSNSTISDCYDLKLEGIGYTAGKVLEYILHKQYYADTGLLSYVGFRKHHPHDDHSTIRIAFKDDDSVSASLQLLSEICTEASQRAIAIYNGIAAEF